MIAPSLSLWLGALGGAAAVVLAITRMSLANLSPGTIRKLELTNTGLAERLEPKIRRADDFRVMLRLLLMVDVIFIVACAQSWDLHCVELGSSPTLRFSPYAIGALAYILLTEWLGQHLTTTGAARFLLVAVPVIRTLGLPVMPLALPIIFWHRWMTHWEDTHQPEEEKATAEDEILSLVDQADDQHDEDTALEEDERRMIRGIFDLDETLVREIMTPRVDLDAVRADADLATVKQTIIHSGHSRIPIYGECVDQISGVIYAKDLLDDSKIQTATSLSALAHQPMFLPETKNVGDLLNEFQQSRSHFAVVLDEYGGTAGVVTFEDILEEIVGEIRDEYDDDEPEDDTVAMPDGSLQIDARMPICELNEVLDLNLPEDEDYDTVAGYIVAATGRIPASGETIAAETAEFQILQADQRRIVRVGVTRCDKDGAAGYE